MRKVRFSGSALGALLMAHVVWGQQDAQFSQYMFNTLFYNPAYAGVEGVTKVQFIARTQWAGYSSTFDGSGGNPNTQMISLTSPVLKIRSGFGLYILNDKLGPLNNIEAQASYAYHLAIKDAKLSIGIKAGIYSQIIDRELYRPNRGIRVQIFKDIVITQIDFRTLADIDNKLPVFIIGDLRIVHVEWTYGHLLVEVNLGGWDILVCLTHMESTWGDWNHPVRNSLNPALTPGNSN